MPCAAIGHANATRTSASVRSTASFSTSENFSPQGPHVPRSTLGRSRSRSTDTTARAAFSSGMVSVPMPGPTSSTTSSAPTSESSRILRSTSSFTRKFWPSDFFVASPCASSTARVAAGVESGEMRSVMMVLPYAPRCHAVGSRSSRARALSSMPCKNAARSSPGGKPNSSARRAAVNTVCAGPQSDPRMGSGVM